jgi:hypothetical protein
MATTARPRRRVSMYGGAGSIQPPSDLFILAVAPTRIKHESQRPARITAWRSPAARFPEPEIFFSLLYHVDFN